MKIRPVGSELCHADGWTDLHTNRQTDVHEKSNEQTDRRA